MMTCTVAENMKMPAVAENRMISPSPSPIEMLQRVIRNNSRKIILFALTSDEVRGGIMLMKAIEDEMKCHETESLLLFCNQSVSSVSEQYCNNEVLLHPTPPV